MATPSTRQQPFYAWDDPKAKCRGPRGAATLEAGGGAAVVNEASSVEGEEGKTSDGHHRRENNRPRRPHQPSFYDREALQEQLQGHESQRIDLSEKKAQLELRLKEAQTVLLDMRARKRGLSEDKMMGEAASEVLLSNGNVRAAGAFRDRKDRQHSNGNGGACRRRETRQQQRDEVANFAAQDRVMELEVLNNQLRRGQVGAEREAKSQQTASRATRAELQKVSERLKAMPRRFTESLLQLRDEVDKLESEKLSLELAKQQRSLKEADLLASAKRQQEYLGEELNALLDEIDDVEDDRDRWKRRLRVESARAASLRSQRDEALEALRDRFGGDAVERTAFALFASSRPKQKQIEGGRGGGREEAGGARWGGGCRRAARRGGESVSDEGGRGGGGNGHVFDEGGGGDCVGSDDDDSSGCCGDVDGREKIPVSAIAKALRPAYGPDCDDDKHDDGVHHPGRVKDGRKVVVTLTAEAIEEAVESACGIDCSTLSEENKRELGLGFGEFLAVANRLTVRHQQID